MNYDTFRSEAKQVDTLAGLQELGDIQIKEAVKVDSDGKIHLIARGREWFFGLTTRQKNGETRYYVCISNDMQTPILSSSIVQYKIKLDERTGDWHLAFQTRFGSIYNVNIGRNAEFNDAAGL